MKELPVKLGPLALLLTVISICMTTLAILTFTTARADKSLADTYAETVKIRYELEIQGQEFMRDLDEDPFSSLMDPEISRDADNIYWKTFSQDDAYLKIGYKLIGSEGYQLVAWRHGKTWEEDLGFGGNLWQGNLH